VGCPLLLPLATTAGASISIFVGDQFIRKGEMEGSEEVSMKELKETVTFLVKQ